MAKLQHLPFIILEFKPMRKYSKNIQSSISTQYPRHSCQLNLLKAVSLEKKKEHQSICRKRHIFKPKGDIWLRTILLQNPLLLYYDLVYRDIVQLTQVPTVLSRQINQNFSISKIVQMNSNFHDGAETASVISKPFSTVLYNNTQNKKQHVEQQNVKMLSLDLPERHKQSHGIRPLDCTRANAPSLIDPLVKSEAFAKQLRQKKKGTILSKKRAAIANDIASQLEIKLLSANCRGLNSRAKQEALARMMEFHSINVVALQETKLTRKLWINNHTTTQTQLHRGGGTVSSTSLPDSKSIKALGTAITWQIIVHNKTPIHLFSIYIEPGDQEKANRTVSNLQSLIDSLIRRTGKPRLIIAGDFNQERPRFDQITSRWGLSPTLQAHSVTHAKGGHLDQVYTNLEIIQTQIIQPDPKFSDHTPIVCRLRFKKKSDDYNMHNDIPYRPHHKLRQAATSAKTISFLLERNSIITCPIKETVENQVRPMKRVRRWYEGVAQHAKYNQSQEEELLQSSIGKNYGNLQWKERMKEIEKLHKDGKWKEFFAQVNHIAKLKVQSAPVQGIQLGDEVILDQREIENILAQHYQQLYDGMEADPCQTQIIGEINLFTAEDIDTAIKSTNFQKGMGPDMFNGEILNKSHDLFMKIRKELTEILNNGNIPAHLKEGRLVALSKKAGQSTVTVEETRPIVIRSHISKILEKAIKAKIEGSSPHLFLTKDGQTGFKKGKSTAHNITQVLQLLHPGRGRQKTLPLLLLIDLRKAFDSLDKSKIFRILRGRCKSMNDHHLVNLIESLHCKSTVQIGDHIIKLNKGVVQGSILAPILFNIYLEEAISSSPLLLKKYMHGSLLAFADDIIVNLHSETEAREVLEEFTKLQGEWNLSLNKEKSLIIGHTKTENIQGVACVTQAKYLGFNLTTDHKKQRIMAEDQISRNIAAIKGKLRHSNNDVKEALINAYARSLLFYIGVPMRAANLWKHGDVEKLEQRTYRKAHCIPNDINTKDLMHISNHCNLAAPAISTSAKRIVNENRKSTTLDNLIIPSRYEAPRQQSAKRPRLYIPRAITETTLALTRGRTILFFGKRHHCMSHQMLVDDENLKSCEHLDNLGGVREAVMKLRNANIHDWEEGEREITLLRVALLKGKLDELVEMGKYKITDLQRPNPLSTNQDQGVQSFGEKGGKSPEVDPASEIKRKRGRPSNIDKIKAATKPLTHYYKAKV